MPYTKPPIGFSRETSNLSSRHQNYDRRWSVQLSPSIIRILKMASRKKSGNNDAEEESLLCGALGCPISITNREHIQNLWSGYGTITRVTFKRADSTGPPETVVVKRVNPPRNIHGDIGHQRKIKSCKNECPPSSPRR